MFSKRTHIVCYPCVQIGLNLALSLTYFYISICNKYILSSCYFRYHAPFDDITINYAIKNRSAII